MSVATAIAAIAAIATRSADEPAVSNAQEYERVRGNEAGDFVPSPAAEQSDAGRAALAWLTLVDSGYAGASREQSADALRARFSESIWELGVALRLNNYGTPVTRELVSVERVFEGDGSVGDFEMLVYRTDFSVETGVREEITVKRENGEWRVADYDATESESC